MGFLSPSDAIFLLTESREHPLHVGSLQLYEPPADAGPEYAREIYENLLAHTDTHPIYRMRPAEPVGTLGHIRMVEERHVDFEYHVRLSALPRPGRIRELFRLLSRLHGTLLDRHMPLWEMHVIEGLEDGRLAIYTKIHHSLIDGVSALRMLEKTLSLDPDDRDCPAPWSPQPRRSRALDSGGKSLLQAGAGLAGDLLGLAPTAVRLIERSVGSSGMIGPLQAPRTMFNVPIGGARRFAAQSWPIDRLRTIGHTTGTTLNDVVLAMCAGALRSYLLDQSALPYTPLIAAVPVSLRSASGDDSGGNAVSTVLCNLGTHLADPLDRLTTITDSMDAGKELVRGVSPMQALAIAAVNLSSIALANLPGYTRFAPPSFNIMISNVPGPAQDVYYNGARLDGLFPLSVVLDGFALNITLTSRSGNLDFGLIGDRHSVPRLQRLLTHLEDSLAGLEKAVT